MVAREIKREDYSWAAGLFEGEGSFPRTGGKEKASNYPIATLQMTDEGPVRRFMSVVEVGSIIHIPISKNNPAYKPMWRWKVHGFEKTQAVVAFLWPWLDCRRRARAKDMLLSYVPGIRLGQINAAKTHCPVGHPYDSVNTQVVNNKWRQCRICNRDRIRARRLRAREMYKELIKRLELV